MQVHNCITMYRGWLPYPFGSSCVKADLSRNHGVHITLHPTRCYVMLCCSTIGAWVKKGSNKQLMLPWHHSYSALGWLPVRAVRTSKSFFSRLTLRWCLRGHRNPFSDGCGRQNCRACSAHPLLHGAFRQDPGVHVRLCWRFWNSRFDLKSFFDPQRCKEWRDLQIQSSYFSFMFEPNDLVNVFFSSHALVFASKQALYNFST